MGKEIFKGLETPDSFRNRDLAAKVSEGIRSGETTLDELEQAKLHKINEVLDHPELDALIDEGKITLAMIKPQANESRDLSSNDQEAADLVMKEIGEENVVFSFSTKFSDANIDSFYEGNSYLSTIREHFKKGSATFVLIYHEEENGTGDAIKWWRGRIGVTNPAEASKDSIRGKHALTVSNNIVHGSDSIASVKREVGILREITSEFEIKSKVKNEDVISALPVEQISESKDIKGICLKAKTYSPRKLINKILTKIPHHRLSA